MDLQTHAGWNNPKTAMEYIEGTKERKRRMASFVTGVRPTPATKVAKRTSSETAREENPVPSPSPKEELIVGGRGKAVYTFDLRGAENFTLNIN